MEGWMHGRMGGWTDRWMVVSWMRGTTEGWMCGWVETRRQKNGDRETRGWMGGRWKSERTRGKAAGGRVLARGWAALHGPSGSTGLTAALDAHRQFPGPLPHHACRGGNAALVPGAGGGAAHAAGQHRRLEDHQPLPRRCRYVAFLTPPTRTQRSVPGRAGRAGTPETASDPVS